MVRYCKPKVGMGNQQISLTDFRPSSAASDTPPVRRAKSQVRASLRFSCLTMGSDMIMSNFVFGLGRFTKAENWPWAQTTVSSQYLPSGQSTMDQPVRTLSTASKPPASGWRGPLA